MIRCLRGTDFCPSCPLRGTIWGQNYEKNMKTGSKYGEKEKIQILIKSLIFCILRIYIFSFYAFLFFRSLADAKIVCSRERPMASANGVFAQIFLYQAQVCRKAKIKSICAPSLACP